MKLEINITKGKFWTLIILIVLAVGVFVFAADPTVFGHSADEISWGTIAGDLEIRDLKITGELDAESLYNEDDCEWTGESPTSTLLKCPDNNPGNKIVAGASIIIRESGAISTIKLYCCKI